MPRTKAKKKDTAAAPSQSPPQLKKVLPAQEKLSRASGVKAQRKRVAAEAKKGGGGKKKKKFEESDETEESEEWFGE